MKNLLLTFAAVAFFSSLLHAQTPATAGDTATNAGSTPATTTDPVQTQPAAPKITLSDARITNVRVAKSQRNIEQHTGLTLDSHYWTALDFGDSLVVTIEGLNELLGDNKIVMNKIILYLDDLNLSELPVRHCCVDCDELTFIFGRRYVDMETLDELKRRAGLQDAFAGVKIDYEKYSMDCCSPPVRIALQEFRDNLVYSGAFVFLLLLAFIYLAWRTPFLKAVDSGTGKYVYSLSRSQLAFWTFIILSTFFYIYTGTDDTEILNTTALVLLGISIATTAIGQTIKSPVVSNKPPSQLIHTNKGSNFFLNIISDDSGVSIHRLQTVIFNFIFGIIFIRTSIFDLSMPDFSTEQLTLLGISSGAYTALKLNEGKGSQNNPQPPAPSGDNPPPPVPTPAPAPAPAPQPPAPNPAPTPTDNNPAAG